jgi:hypothetical protein
VPRRENERRPSPGISKAVAAHFQPNRQKAEVSGAGYMLGRDVADADRRDEKTVIDCYF